MASEEHKHLADDIKSVHENLRKSAKLLGPTEAWNNHLKNRDLLENYAKTMKNLASIWENNTASGSLKCESRIKWITCYCKSYFIEEKLIIEKRKKEEHLADIFNFAFDFTNLHLMLENNIKMLDVGSCFNPFKNIDIFDVTAIDISPADESVFAGDFLNIELNSESLIFSCDKTLKSIPKDYFDCILFSLFLEYLPSSEQRIMCCKRAYELLKFEGLLIVITPDSQHVGKNAKLMKNWRYTLGKLGFSRIKFEKLSHITCMVFRKCLSKSIAERWSDIHKEEYMTFSIKIPQDYEQEDTQVEY